MNNVYLLLGGNVGDVAATFRKAENLIVKAAGPVIRSSSLFQSPPWGFDSNEAFINQVLNIRTPLAARQLMGLILEIENSLGRKRQEGVITSRTIDIDILFFNQDVIDQPELQIPHPRLHLRRFTLVPLAEIEPGLIHPVFNETISGLLKKCPDKSNVIRIDA